MSAIGDKANESAKGLVSLLDELLLAREYAQRMAKKAPEFADLLNDLDDRIARLILEQDAAASIASEEATP